MKNFNLFPNKHFRFVAVLCLLLSLCSSNAWGTVATLSFSGTGTPANNKNYTDNQSKTWTLTSDNAGYWALESDGRIHGGSGSKSISHLTFTSSAFNGVTITQITVTGYGSNCSAYATVNGSNFGTQGQSATSNGTKTFTGSATVTGNVVVKIQRSSASKNAIYCSQITVTYSAGSTKTLVFVSSPFMSP